MMNQIINIGLILIAVLAFVYLLLPDFFPVTNMDEFMISGILFAILERFGVKIV